MRLGTPEQISVIEKKAEELFSISPEILMENAGSLSAREIQTSFMPELQRGRVAVLCGPGNNGGDGMVVARHLIELGFSGTEVFLVGENPTPLNKLQNQRLAKQGIKVCHLNDVKILEGFDLYVDALFGVGLSRPIEGLCRDVIAKVNDLNKSTVSLDIPSGLHAMTGKILGVCFKSQLTLTFGLAKPGLYSAHGADYAGRIRVIPIGFPKSLVQETANTHLAINEKWVKRFLPKRKRDSHKFDHGRLYIVAGQPGTWGAAALCCRGAYRMGAGYVTLVTEKESAQRFLGKDLGPEVLLSDFSNPEIFEKGDAFVVGPGSGKGSNVENFISKLIEAKKEKVLIDADGLSVISQIGQKHLPKSWILTPHAGEMARLLNFSSDEIENDRLKFSNLAAQKIGCCVLLKGFRSVFSTPDGLTAIIIAGNAALAKAGTGDVLSGFIGALLAQGLDSFSAGSAGAFMHGRISDSWVKSGKDIKSLVASDLIEFLPGELSRVESD